MIPALIAATPAEGRLLGGGRLRGPTPSLLALMMFVTVIIAAAGLALAGAARIASQGIDNRFTVQITGAAERQAVAAARLRALPGVAAVRPVPEDLMRSTLERWMGPESAAGDLPLPTLIDVDLAPGADLPALRRAVEQTVPDARLIAHREALAPVTSALRALGWVALILVVLVGMATVAAVVLATRGALGAHRSTIDVMHGVGATDEQIARLFQRRMALDSLIGGSVGAVAAGIVLLLVAGSLGRWLDRLGGSELIGPLDIVLLALLPLAGTVLAAFAARRAVLRSLEERL